MQTTIVKWGNSQGIRLPKHLLDTLHLAHNDIVEVLIENGRIIIKKLESKRGYKSIQERFKDFDGVYECEEINWGNPAGKEVW